VQLYFSKIEKKPLKHVVANVLKTVYICLHDMNCINHVINNKAARSFYCLISLGYN